MRLIRRNIGSNSEKKDKDPCDRHQPLGPLHIGLLCDGELLGERAYKVVARVPHPLGVKTGNLKQEC
jgi:hypothetical protein